MLNRDTKRKFEELKRRVQEKRKKISPPVKTDEDVKAENYIAEQLMPYIYNRIGEVS